MAELIRNLQITALIHGGRGIGRYDGKAVFVSLTMPGDRVSCRVVKSRKRFIEAELCEIIEPSALRREPPCPLFGACGGCQWQHIPYPEQLRSKEQTFSDLLLRNKLADTDSLKPIVPAPEEWCYRNRVQLKCQLLGDRLLLGFYRHGSHALVDVAQCLLIAPQIQSALNLLRDDLQSAPCRESFVQIDLSCDDNGTVRMVLYSQPKGGAALRDWLKSFAASNSLNASLKQGRNSTADIVHGDGDLMVKVDHPELCLSYGPGAFVQVNSAQNRNLIASMLELLALDGTEEVLELFCGMGNFSLPLARRVKHLAGVEDYAPSIAKARANAAANHIDNVDFHTADAVEFLARYQGNAEPDIVVLDPPRTGNLAVASQLQRMRPKKILYVSCDPATLVRDLTPLVADGYEVVSSQPFDLFPQTWHIESMTLLRRVGG